jgi:aminoglycoside N3'-acetyltransferase
MPPHTERPRQGVTDAIRILERLGVGRDGILYVQSSVDWLMRLGISGLDVLHALDEHAPTATLVMPSYPMLVPHREYVASKPAYDVRRTPAQVGLVAELFRRMPRVARSLEPDYPVAARGPAATMLTSGVPQPDPFGDQSPYRRILSGRGTLIGLGVSLNTNSFIHAFDSALEREYPFPVYEPGTISLDVITATNEIITVPRRVLREEFQRYTQPSAIAVTMGDTSAFAAFAINGVQFFRWNLDALEAWAMSHARQRLAHSGLPCWLARLTQDTARTTAGK